VLLIMDPGLPPGAIICPPLCGFRRAGQAVGRPYRECAYPSMRGADAVGALWGSPLQGMRVSFDVGVLFWWGGIFLLYLRILATNSIINT
jgi:hypothetical protein